MNLLAIALVSFCIVGSRSVPLQREAAAVSGDDFLAQFLGLGDGDEKEVFAKQEEKPLLSSSTPLVFGGNEKVDDDSDEADVYYGAAIFCRMRIYPFALNPVQCSEVLIKDYKPDFLYDDPHRNKTGGQCFWDRTLGKHQQGGCMCPRPKDDCQSNKECYWHTYPGLGGLDEPDVSKRNGYCIHNSERFYNLLARLLAKRGKKDLSLKIKFSSAPARGKLPYGPHGPAVIGFGERFGEYFDQRHNYPGSFRGYGFEGGPYGVKNFQQTYPTAYNGGAARWPGCPCLSQRDPPPFYAS